ncbi:hypothetical protein ACHAPG_000164 [Botrytis cinerea]
MSSQLNRYWIPNFDINKRVITKEIQYYLGPESTLRPYTRDVRTDRRYLYQVEGALGKASSSSSQEGIRQATKAASTPASRHLKRIKAPFSKIPSSAS